MQPSLPPNVVSLSSSPTAAHTSSSLQPSSLWRGRAVYKAKNESIIKAQAIGCAITIITLVGLLISSSFSLARLLLGGGLAIAMYCGYEIYQDFQSPNELEKALKHLTHQTNLDNLPEISWKTREKSIGSLPQLCTWEASSMTQTVMALKEKGKTIAVAIKYFDSSYGLKKEPRHMIAVFSFKNKFEECTNQRKDGDNIFIFTVRGFITAREGHLLENLLQNKQ